MLPTIPKHCAYCNSILEGSTTSQSNMILKCPNRHISYFFLDQNVCRSIYTKHYLLFLYTEEDECQVFPREGKHGEILFVLPISDTDFDCIIKLEDKIKNYIAFR